MKENSIVYFRGLKFWVMGEVDRLPYAIPRGGKLIETLLMWHGAITNIVGVPTEWDMVIDTRTGKRFAVSANSDLPIWELQAI